MGPDKRLLSASVTPSGGTVSAGTPVPLFVMHTPQKAGSQPRVSDMSPYAVVGDRFLVTETDPDPRLDDRPPLERVRAGG